MWHVVFFIRLPPGYLCWMATAGLRTAWCASKFALWAGSHPGEAVLWSGRGSARVHGGFTPSAPLRLCQWGDFTASLSPSMASASPLRLSHPARSTSLQRWKLLTIFLHRRLFARGFLVWSSALCSGPADSELGDLQGTLPGSFCFQSFTLGGREGHNRGNLQCAQLRNTTLIDNTNWSLWECLKIWMETASPMHRDDAPSLCLSLAKQLKSLCSILVLSISCSQSSLKIPWGKKGRRECLKSQNWEITCPLSAPICLHYPKPRALPKRWWTCPHHLTRWEADKRRAND